MIHNGISLKDIFSIKSHILHSYFKYFRKMLKFSIYIHNIYFQNKHKRGMSKILFGVYTFA